MAEKTYDVTELFGSDVFNEAVMKARLPKAIFKELMKVMHGNAELTLPIAEVVASTMKDWAVEKVVLDRDAHDILELGLKAGLTFSVTAGNVIRLVPALTITEAEADELVKRITPVIRSFLSQPKI